MVILAIAAAILSTAEIQAAIGSDPATCTLVRYATNGARTEQPPTKSFRPSAGASATVRSSAGGATSTSSSVSVSSARRDGVGVSSSRVVRDGVSITFDQDNQGCRVIVDERPAQGAKR